MDNERIQRILDTAENCMKEAGLRTYSGLAGARVLHALVAVLLEQFLTKEQQQQVEVILDLHEGCLLRNGEVKG